MARMTDEDTWRIAREAYDKAERNSDAVARAALVRAGVEQAMKAIALASEDGDEDPWVIFLEAELKAGRLV